MDLIFAPSLLNVPSISFISVARILRAMEHIIKCLLYVTSSLLGQNILPTKNVGASGIGTAI
jgi:hypothetical protein